MATHGSTPLLERRHLRRHCMQCGLNAEAVLAQHGEACPRCGCDFHARPPRSYAELEGLLELAPAPEHARAQAQLRTDAVAARWLVVLLAVMGLAAGAVVAALLLAAR